MLSVPIKTGAYVGKYRLPDNQHQKKRKVKETENGIAVKKLFSSCQNTISRNCC